MSDDCRICGEPTYLSDDLGPAHPCCVWWAVQAPGLPCPACAPSRARAREAKRRERLAAERREAWLAFEAETNALDDGGGEWLRAYFWIEHPQGWQAPWDGDRFDPYTLVDAVHAQVERNQIASHLAKLGQSTGFVVRRRDGVYTSHGKLLDAQGRTVPVEDLYPRA